MSNSNFITTSRTCNGYLIPSGEEIKLKEGTKVKITQSLGGDFTLYVNGNLVKISGVDADVIGQKIDHKIKNIDSVLFNEKINMINKIILNTIMI